MYRRLGTLPPSFIGIFRTSWRMEYSVPATVDHPTIYALSTPAGLKSAIAVIRISGTNSKYVYKKLTRTKKAPLSHKASVRNLYDPTVHNEKSLLDNALTLFFEQPKTFTGEDVLELHVHGGKAVVSGVLKAIESLHDFEEGYQIRYAQPGEFSMRGFQNGKFDLTQVEGVGDLIDAETEIQRKSAICSFRGDNKVRFSLWREKIVANIAQLAAVIDFGDDTEIDDIEMIVKGVNKTMLELKQDIEQFLHKTQKSNILKSGIKLALLGPPNAGKSSLLNSITNDETAIVSNTPGTTRDTIDVPLDMNGYKIIITDTAGIRPNATDEIEVIGINRAKLKCANSDIVLLLIDPTNRQLVLNDLKQYIREHIDGKKFVIVINKTDLLNEQQLKEIKIDVCLQFGPSVSIMGVSCLEKKGIDNLINTLTDIFKDISDSTDEDPISVSKRVQEILKNDVLYGIDEFVHFAETNDVVMASESLGFAADGIGKITGETVGVEEILGVVFSNFCVGK